MMQQNCSSINILYDVIGLIILFVICPFAAYILAIFKIKKIGDSEKQMKWLFVIISLYMGFLACTQYTTSGDVSRTYSSIIVNDLIGFKAILLNKYILFDSVNYAIYKIFGRVEFVSILWTFSIYFFFLNATYNICVSNSCIVDYKLVTNIFIMCALCLVYFVQVTEIMKQAVAISLGYYAFSLYALNKYMGSIIYFVLALGVHFSILFFLPLFFLKRIESKYIIIAVICSFAFRGFNLMHLVSQYTFLGSVSAVASGYIGETSNFFKSSSFFFTIIFFFYVILSFFTYLMSQDKNSIFIKAILVMIVILNLNYSISHNFTRLLTTMYPFYALLLCELYKTNMIEQKRKIVVLAVVIFNISIGYVLTSGRLDSNSSYRTSYMNNSIKNIVFSTSYNYLINTKGLYY